MATVREIDPHDESAFGAWYDAMREGLVAGRTAPIVFARDEIGASLRNPGTSRSRVPYAAYSGGDVVGAMLLDFPLKENTDMVEWTLSVPPALRGRGIGGALYEAGLAVADEKGRGTHLAEIDVPADAGVEACAGSRFALRHGFVSMHTEDRLVLDLPLGSGRLGELRAHAAERHAAYSFATWTGACPEEHVDAYTRMRTVMGEEVPTGELEHEPIVWDAERLRESESRMAAQGFTTLVTAARDATGAFAGYSLMFVPEHTPDSVYQDDTLVLDGHRGHRLGAALKVRNLDVLAEHFPGRRWVHTWNAQSNDAMQHVNDAFGFRAVETMHEFERKA